MNGLFTKLIEFLKKRQLTILFILAFLIIIIWHYSLIFSREFWYDEAFTGLVIRNNIPNIIEQVKMDVHPPLYYIGLKLWSYLSGNNDIGLRSFSLAANIAMLIAIYIFLKKYFANANFALLLTFIVGINPFLSLYAAEARMYSLFAFLYFLAFYFIYKALENQHQFLSWLLFVFFYTLALYTHYIAILAILPFIIYILFKKNRLDNYLRFIISLLAIFILYYPWLHVLLTRYNSMPYGLEWIPPISITALIKSFSIFIFGHQAGSWSIAQVNEFQFFHLSNGAITAIFSLMMLLALILLIKIRKLYNLLPFFIFSYISIFSLSLFYLLKNLQLFHERFLIAFIPFFIIFVFSLLYFILNKKLFYAIAGLYIILAFLIKIPANNYKYSDIAEFIVRNPKISNVIVIEDETEFVLIKYYLGDDAPVSIKIYNMSCPYCDYSKIPVITNANRVTDLKNLSPNTFIIANNKDYLKKIYQDAAEQKIKIF